MQQSWASAMIGNGSFHGVGGLEGTLWFHCKLLEVATADELLRFSLIVSHLLFVSSSRLGGKKLQWCHTAGTEDCKGNTYLFWTTCSAGPFYKRLMHSMRAVLLHKQQIAEQRGLHMKVPPCSCKQGLPFSCCLAFRSTRDLGKTGLAARMAF